jgi:hypothetical protein
MEDEGTNGGLVPPLKTWAGISEAEAKAKLEELAAAVSTVPEAARAVVVGFGNYVWETQGSGWPDFIARANELVGEFDDDLSRRWG